MERVASPGSLPALIEKKMDGRNYSSGINRWQCVFAIMISLIHNSTSVEKSLKKNK